MTGFGILWFVLIFVLIAGYFVLDGFDLGVGILYPFLGKDEETKSLMRRAIGPVWDGNEVWLLTAGGALFAAFAPAYATSFSGFYLAIMLVLFALIIRAVAIEFRSHETDYLKAWDIAFFIGSLLPALLFGVAIGNIIEGIPLNANGDYTGTFFALLNPFALLCGVLGLAHMISQGAAWIALKAPEESELRTKAVSVRNLVTCIEVLIFLIAGLVYYFFVMPNSAVGIGMPIVASIFEILYAFAMIFVIFKGRNGSPKFDLAMVVALSLACICLVGMVGASLFPNIIPATEAAMSITIANAASSDTALKAMTIIAAIGVPLVLAYHVIVYRVFRGRLK